MSGKVWLVRGVRNEILGPFDREELVKLIRTAKLRPQDEVSHSESFWFFLHETEEVKNQLGLDPSEIHWGSAEDATKIYADIHSEATDPDVHSRSPQPNGGAIEGFSSGERRVPVETPFLLRVLLLGLVLLLGWVAYEIWIRAL